MSFENIEKALYLSEASSLDFLGIKILDAFPDSSIERRVGLNFDTLKIIDLILKLWQEKVKE